MDGWMDNRKNSKHTTKSHIIHINTLKNNEPTPYRLATSKGIATGRRPSGAVLHSSREPVVRRPCSDLTDMLRRLINCRIIIIIIIITR